MAIRRPTYTHCGTLLAALLFSISHGAAQDTRPKLTTLYSFPAGLGPVVGLVIGQGGVLYGTTQTGGTDSCPGNPGCGTVFSLTPPTSAGGVWTETTIYNFTGGSDGSFPSGVAIGSGGVLYGTTANGGISGTVFSLTPPTSPGGVWTETTLYNFTGTTDGASPQSGVTMGKKGVLYGTTLFGGTANSGTVFRLKPPASQGGVWTEAVLHSFTGGSDGTLPYGSVVVGSGGVLYGTTTYGGTGPCTVNFSGCGTVFSLTPPASPGGAWTEAVLHNFTGSPSDGAYTQGTAGVVIGSGGVLYGTTYSGGTGSSCFSGCGTVFSLTPPASPGGTWTEAVLHSFKGPPRDGNGPFADVVIGSDGVLYGTTYGGGSSYEGTVFSLTPPASPGGGWTETRLHNFTGGSDGLIPAGGVVKGTNGVLYGTTEAGGTSNGGTVFKLKP